MEVWERSQLRKMKSNFIITASFQVHGSVLIKSVRKVIMKSVGKIGFHVSCGFHPVYTLCSHF